MHSALCDTQGRRGQVLGNLTSYCHQYILDQWGVGSLSSPLLPRMRGVVEAQGRGHATLPFCCPHTQQPWPISRSFAPAEWVLVDAALHAYNMVSVPLYDTLGADAVEYICNHAELSAIACSAAVLPVLMQARTWDVVVWASAAAQSCGRVGQWVGHRWFLKPTATPLVRARARMGRHKYVRMHRWDVISMCACTVGTRHWPLAQC